MPSESFCRLISHAMLLPADLTIEIENVAIAWLLFVGRPLSRIFLSSIDVQLVVLRFWVFPGLRICFLDFFQSFPVRLIRSFQAFRRCHLELFLILSRLHIHSLPAFSFCQLSLPFSFRLLL